jgi:hypothetical protein
MEQSCSWLRTHLNTLPGRHFSWTVVYPQAPLKRLYRNAVENRMVPTDGLLHPTVQEDGSNRRPIMRGVVLALALWAPGLSWSAREVAFSQSAASVAAYDFVEVSLWMSTAVPGNPFTEAVVTGWFAFADGSGRVNVDGFCDSRNGTLFRIRFRTSKPALRLYREVHGEGL